jgi:predicted phosphodiesterase
VWETLTRHNALCVQGIGDRALARIDPKKLAPSNDQERARAERHAETRSALGELILVRLAKLPTEARLPLQSGHTMQVVHGSPRNPTEAITLDMDDDEMLAMLGDDPGDLVVCGASHVPFDRTIADVRVVNVGSVGVAPGGGYAHAVIVEDAQAGVRFTPFDVTLD